MLNVQDLTPTEKKSFESMKEAFLFLDTPEDPKASEREALEYIKAGRLDVATFVIPVFA